MYKAGLIICISAVVVLLSLGVGRTALSPQGKVSERFRQKTGEATRIQEGVLTEKQKKHSKIFKGFKNVTRGKRLPDAAARTGGELNVYMEVGNVIRPRNAEAEDYLREMTCQSDAVLVGTVTSKSSHLIDEGTFVFTDYEVTATEVIKDNAAALITADASVTYTGPGGAVELDGRTIRAVDGRNEPLQVGGSYLLYLKYIPETDSYKAYAGSNVYGDVFRLSEGVVIQASEKPLPFGGETKGVAAAFLTAARAALKHPCNMDDYKITSVNLTLKASIRGN